MCRSGGLVLHLVRLFRLHFCPDLTHLHPGGRTAPWQHADEAWISQALKSSPWRVRSPEAADIIYLDGHHFSRWCTASRILAMHNTQNRVNRANVSVESACPGREPVPDAREARYARDLMKERRRTSAAAAADGSRPVPLTRDEVSKRMLWRQMLETSAKLVESIRSHTPSTMMRRIPRVVALTSNECPAPYGPSRQPKETDLLLLVDQKPRTFDVVTPYVVSKPDWLANAPGASPPPVPPWSQRKLLFFAGHTPKLTQRATRYLLWKQLRRSAHVSALSSTIGCNIASYEVCASATRIEAEFSTFCHSWCHSKVICVGSAAILRKHCKYIDRYVNYTDERDDLRRSALQGRLTHDEYLALARSHRFCLVAPVPSSTDALIP